MRAVLCSEHGPPEKLKVAEVDDPKPQRGQGVLNVEACGINFPDTLIIEDKYQFHPPLPFSPGGEVAGVIESLGEGVTGFEVGEKVIALMPFGGYAEKVAVDYMALLKRPPEMDGVSAAGFSMTYGTSMHALKQRANLQKGETLLVLGAGGGVGLTAVQLGKAMGAEVIAAASTNEKLQAAKESGADHLINYSEGSLRDKIKEIRGKKGVDVVYDAVGGDLFEQALRSTTWKGRVLVIGFASGKIPKIPMNLPLLKGLDIIGVFWGAFRERETDLDNKNFQELFDLYKEGKIKPFISKKYSLEEAPDALNDLLKRKVIGKVVLTTENKNV
ncbi:MAG: NADPH:quinone oxidoreductase family protein [Bdellovibrionota bacterium]|nr:NADPH:quinone oxidoreductase family protein [Bdellovibrionota bacterium]